MKKGFTLIELLVVLLIIGILVAIALPQYQNAVTHSRYSQLHVAASTLRSAALRYRLAMSEWPVDWNALDVSFKGTISEDGTKLTMKESYCQYYEDDESIDGLIACFINKPPQVGYLVSYLDTNQYCLAPAENLQAAYFCQTMGGEEVTSKIDGMLQYTIP